MSPELRKQFTILFESMLKDEQGIPEEAYNIFMNIFRSDNLINDPSISALLHKVDAVDGRFFLPLKF